MKAAREFDPSTIDCDAFVAELRQLRKEVDENLGAEDIRHLQKMERQGWAASLLGWATSWVAPNPVSMVALSLGRSTRWMVMHHVGHKGYDKVPGVPARFTSEVFAKGLRRYLDWPDWMVPEAWIYEHNVLHHSYTGEERDPDLVERNMEGLRQSKVPVPLRYAAMGAIAMTWRFVYYAPSTLRVWRNRASHQPTAPETDDGSNVRQPRGHEFELWTRCYLPYAAMEFVAMPLAYLPLGPWAVFSAFVNSVGAEVLTNIHTFCVIAPNHTGDDMYRYTERPKSRVEAVIRQIVSSTNYACGGDGNDYAHLWLNYQIEHHIWPDLPMLKYQQVQPKVKALCEKYGIPYAQESVLVRVKRMLQVAVGTTTMKKAAGFLRDRSAARPVHAAAE